MQTDLKIAFWGTSKFAVPILELLVKKDWPINLVVTLPDEPAGRKQILTSPPIKIIAENLSLKIEQPTNLSDYSPAIKYDLAIICSYGKIIPNKILQIPSFGNINIHPSLLPKYRGPSPIQTALLNGDSETGISLMLIDQEMDHGPILKQKIVKIDSNETFTELSQRLSKISAELLCAFLPQYLSKNLKAEVQNHKEATFSYMLSKNDGRLDWKKSSIEIFNQWRALQPWPGVWSDFNLNSFDKNKKIRIKLLTLNLLSEKKFGNFGDFLKFDKNRLGIICGDNKIIEITKLQPEGKKIMTAREFINGYRIT